MFYQYFAGGSCYISVNLSVLRAAGVGPGQNLVLKSWVLKRNQISIKKTTPSCLAIRVKNGEFTC